MKWEDGANNLPGGGVNQESNETEVARFSSPRITHKTRKRNKAEADREGTETSARQVILQTDSAKRQYRLQHCHETGGHTFLMGVKRGHPI